MIKVLSLVSYPFLPAHTGGQKAIALFHRYLAAKIPLVCVTTHNNDVSVAQGYTVLNILSDNPVRYANIFYFFTLRKIIREHQVTHLLLEHPYYGWLGFLLKKFSGVRLVVRSHNVEGLRWKSLGKWWWNALWRYEAWTHRCADYNLFIQQDELDYAVKNFRLSPQTCIEVTYGVEITGCPSSANRQQAREQLNVLHNIPTDHTILLFNGSFNYLPNLNALQTIITKINPALQQKTLSYTFLICGKDIPAGFEKQQIPNILFAGFVEDITLYLKGADIFLNPVMEGGGVKTKIVEAIAQGSTVISTQTGATGMNISVCGEKLVMVQDNDWEAFAAAVVGVRNFNDPTPLSFYEHYYWGNIVDKTVQFLTSN